MFEQNQESKNIVTAITAIKRIGIVGTENDIAEHIGYHKANLSHLKMGRRNLPQKQINKIIESYHLNKAFIYKNELPVFDPAGPFDKYNNLADPSNHDINEKLDRIEKNQAKIMSLLSEILQK